MRALGHVHFSSTLLEVCQSEGLKGKRVKKSPGMYIEGISLNPKVFERGYQFGFTIIDFQVNDCQVKKEDPNLRIVGSDVKKNIYNP